MLEMDGCVTPGNTMGMGNPLPAGEEHTGSEPICPSCKKAKAKKQKKEVKESILDDDLENTVIIRLVKDWLVEYLHWEKRFVDENWDIAEDGTLSLKVKSTARYVDIILMDPFRPFPGKWDENDDPFTFQIDAREDFDWKKLNLPDQARGVTVSSAGKIKINLTGLTYVGDGEIKINVNSKDIPTIKFDPKLKAKSLKIYDGVWNNDNLGNMKISFPSSVKDIELPKSMASAMLSKQMGANIKIN